jgi:hydrogenase expression/formation protein HypC
MCLGIPMQVLTLHGQYARCHAKGVERDVNLFLLQHDPAEVGDFVLVHVGYAIQKIAPQAAQSAWELYDRIMDTDTTRMHRENPDDA